MSPGLLAARSTVRPRSRNSSVQGSTLTDANRNCRPRAFEAWVSIDHRNKDGPASQALNQRPANNSTKASAQRFQGECGCLEDKSKLLKSSPVLRAERGFSTHTQCLNAMTEKTHCLKPVGTSQFGATPGGLIQIRGVNVNCCIRPFAGARLRILKVNFTSVADIKFRGFLRQGWTTG